MNNQEIAKILRDIALYLEMDNVQFKPRAYEKAADSIEALEESLESIYKKDGIRGLMRISGVGEGIAEKIEELIVTGRCKTYERLKKKIPVDIESLSAIEGVGPKRIKILYQKLKVKNVSDLEKLAKTGKIAKLEGFGKKSEENILRGIEFLKKSSGRLLLGYVLPIARDIEKRLKSLKEIEEVVIGGSLRRRKETIGDIDILAISSKPEKVIDFFVKMPEVVAVYAKGPTKSTVRLKIGCDCDLRVLEQKSFGAALQYFTGNVDHNVELRKIAISKGLKLSEYGVFRGNKQIAGRTEEEVYKLLIKNWIEPELREFTGEIQAALKNKLPKIIEYGSLKGDLQTQTNWTDGQNSIKEMAEAAKKYGLEYIAITDHTKTLAMAKGLDEKRLIKQMNEIDKLNKQLNGIILLKGAEVNILKDGRLDINNETLKKLDIVGVSIHSNFKMPEQEITKRIISAMENENSDILFHPTGRLLKQRAPYDVDIDKIIDAAKRTGTILEIDALPDRLDLKDEHIRKAVEAGCKLVIDSDAHNTLHFKYLELGIAQARRGWAEAKDVINTKPLKEFLKMLK
jgi:DNA polymerase (family 10)